MKSNNNITQFDVKNWRIHPNVKERSLQIEDKVKRGVKMKREKKIIHKEKKMM